ncbi:MAG: DUF1350 family protein [Cyanobacteria bacterium J06638_20]
MANWQANWQNIFDNWVLVPENPRGAIHFLGGAFVATVPQVSYRCLLEGLADEGYVVIATPFVNTLDHGAIAQEVLASFERAWEYVRTRLLRSTYLPLYGMGHSMGCKLHLLIGSQLEQVRDGNILMAYNNYPLRKAVPLGEEVYQVTNQLSAQFATQITQLTEQFAQLAPEVKPNLDVEFTPSPEETSHLVETQYQVKRNLLLKFTTDTIDQTRPLHDILRVRYPEMTSVQILKGNHLTPLSQDLKWQAGESFSPLDAIGQMVNQTMKQTVNRDFYQLQKAILRWLDPVAYI